MLPASFGNKPINLKNIPQTTIVDSILVLVGIVMVLVVGTVIFLAEKRVLKVVPATQDIYPRLNVAQIFQVAKLLEAENLPEIATPEASSSATPAITRQLIIEIINASGINGAGNDLKSSLEKQGLTVASTKTGPASTETILRVKEEAKNLVSVITQSVESKFTITKQETLAADSNVDVQIVLGKTKK